MSTETQAAIDRKQFERVTGLFERCELGHMLEEDVEFYIEKAGETDEGDPLYALYESVYVCKDCRAKERGDMPQGGASPP